MQRTPAAWAARAALTLALQGCVAYRAAPLIPSAELEALGARATTPLPERSTGSIPTEWLPLEAEIDVQDGLSLAEANALALFYAPRVRAARTAADVAAGQLLQAGLLRNPELAAGPRFTSSPTDVILSATLLFGVPLGGRRGAEEDRARAELGAAQLEVMAVELEVLIDVRTRFLRVRTLEQEQRLLEALAEQNDAALAWVSRLAEAGEATPLAGPLARLERDEARHALREKEAEVAAARAGLLEAIGLLATAPVEIAGEASGLPPLPDAAPDAVLAHPRLRLLEEEYRAAEHALRLEVAKQYPELGIGPDYEYDQGDSSLGFGVVLELPFFDRNRGGIAAAESLRDAARERYRAEVLRLARVEAEARALHDAARDALDRFRAETLQAVERAERVVAERLRAGQSDLLELLEARRAAARARLRAVALEERAQVAKLQAAYAGGWVLPRNPEGEDR